MRYACTNCLEPHRGPYQLCDKCRELAMNMYPPEWPACPEVEYIYNGGCDQVYVEALKERRMASYARARRMAKRGN